MPVISPYYVALACGTAGAYVDITSYVSWAPGEGVAGSWGKQDQFRDANPGTWSFYLNNLDGRFTPDTTNGILATPLTEGMGVNWQLGTRFIAGSIIGFTMFNDNMGRIRIDVDDMLGDLARNQIDLISRSMVLGANPYLYWPFNEPVGSSRSLEQSGNQQPAFDGSATGFALPNFGIAAIPNIGETQVSTNSVFPTVGYNIYTATAPSGLFSTINYPTNSMGCWGAWFTPTDASSRGDVYVRLNGFTHSFVFGISSSSQYRISMGSASLISSVPVAAGVPHYLQMVVTNSGSASITAELFIDGVSQGTCVWVGIAPDGNGLATNALRTPQWVGLVDNSGGTDPVVISHLSHTPAPVPEYLLTSATEAALFSAIVATSYGVTLGALPSDLSTAPASQITGAGSALAKINDVIRSEQGYLNCATTGTLTAPVQVVTVRARNRPATASYTFSADTELANAPEFIRDLTNLVASATAQGPTSSTTYLDPTLASRAGSSNKSDPVVLTQYVDQLGYAQDRVLRGKNTALRTVSFQVNALTTPTDRSADLLAIKFGDRVQITEISNAGLGFTTYDGWVIGRSEAQDIGQHLFTFYIQPVLPATAIYDTNLYMSGGLHTLNATINSSVTSLGCLSSDLLTYFEQSATPYTILIDSEQITVTACGAPSAGVQTMTVTRAANGTTAAAHTAGAAIEIATASLYAF